MARSYNHSSYYDYLQYFSLPIHFFFFIAVVFIFLTLTFYINYESKFEDMMDNFKMCLMVSPVVLLLFVHWLSSDDREGAPFLSLPEKDSLHRVGGSPLGVAILLVFLMFMISHHSSLQERLFPLFSRR
ncbi:hypothetical protein BUALT_Bualt02G0011500 [Buddleja alternifolia]|uniref:Transmembrane protein n=1 Tax=Buddleja alternifolia TaxID=168488 RepID=A0AAV6Y2Y6_9LAMI|nr:hypothetical protein BUALT_Bualt02G0011500 [Buddleja alternifolia]